jgi:capsular exopolysaccharide synthesis family protein
MLNSKDFWQFDTQNSFDFKGFLVKMVSYWKWFLASWIIAFIIAYNINVRKEKIYAVDTTIAVKEESNPLFTSNTSLTFNWGGTSDQVQNIAMTLTSRSHNEDVVDKLGFYVDYLKEGNYNKEDVYGSTPFLIVLDKDNYQLLNIPIAITFINQEEFEINIPFESDEVQVYNYFTKTASTTIVPMGEYKKRFKVGQKIILPFLNCTLKLTDNPGFIADKKYFIRFNNFDGVVARYKSIATNIEPKAPSILKLSLQGNNKARLVDYLNATVEILIKKELDRKNKFATNTISFIDSTLIDMGNKLKANEDEIKTFSQDKNVYEIEAGGQVLSEKLTEYDLQKDAINRKIAYYNNLRAYLTKSTDYSKLPAPSVAGIEDPNIIANVSKLILLSTEREEMTYSVKNEKMFKEFDKDIEALKKVILETIASAKTSLDYDLSQVNDRIQSVDGEIKKLPAAQQELMKITRNFNLNNVIFTKFLEKRNEADIVKAANLPDLHFIDTAKDTGGGQIGPKTGVNYILAFLLGLFLPLTVIFTKFFLENSILSTDEIAKLTKVPVIGVVGYKKTESDLAVYEKPKSALAESFRAIRSSLQFLYKKNNLEGSKTLMLTSSISGEGKTFCSINIATVFALSEKKTVIVGLDLRKPRIFDDFKINNTTGVVHYLIGQRTLEEVTQKSHIPFLDIITSGPIPPNPSELLLGDLMGDLIAELKQKYDYIVLDTPPIGLVSDSVELANYADVVLYVMRQNYTKKDMISLLNNHVNRGELKNVSIIFNGYESKAKYGTRYGTGYGYGYGAYASGYHVEDDPKRLLARIKAKFTTKK